MIDDPLRPFYKIVDFALDRKSIHSRNAEVEKERSIAVYDLLEENYFKLSSATDGFKGPYHVLLSLQDDLLSFHVRQAAGDKTTTIAISTRPFRKIIKDYFIVCESYYQAIKVSSLSKIEAIDMGRRALHNEGASLLEKRLSDAVALDDQTARRLFTLLCVLHFKG